MAKPEPIPFEEGRRLLRNLTMFPEGRKTLEYILQLLGDGEPLANSDPRKQERNVALHDVAVEIKNQAEE